MQKLFELLHEARIHNFKGNSSKAKSNFRSAFCQSIMSKSTVLAGYIKFREGKNNRDRAPNRKI